MNGCPLSKIPSIYIQVGHKRLRENSGGIRPDSSLRELQQMSGLLVFWHLSLLG